MFPIFEGFNNYSTDPTDHETGVLMRQELWNSTGNVASFSFEDLNGGKAISLNTAGGNCSLISNDFPSQPSHLIGGFRFKRPVAGDFQVQKNFFWMDLGTQSEDYFRFSFYPEGPQDFTLIVTVLSYQEYTVNSYIYNIAAGVWHYAEFDLDLGDTTATLKIRMNGNLVVDESWARGGLATTARRIQLFGNPDTQGDASVPRFSDLYLLDADDASNGATFQQFLGPIEIRPNILTADAESEWTAQGAASRREAVDELPAHDSDTTYVTTSQSPTKQRFLSQTQVDRPTLAVQTTAVVKQVSPTPAVAQLVLEAYKGGLLSEVPQPVALQSVYRSLTGVFTALPDGSPLTKANIEATEWGFRADESA